MFIGLFIKSIGVIAGIILISEAVNAIVFKIKGHKNYFIDDKED